MCSGFSGPVDAKVALLNGSVDAWHDLGALHHPAGETAEGHLVSGKGLLPGNTFAATDASLKDPVKTAPETICIAWRAPSAGPAPS